MKSKSSFQFNSHDVPLLLAGDELTSLSQILVYTPKLTDT